jgi:hypothetical protein
LVDRSRRCAGRFPWRCYGFNKTHRGVLDGPGLHTENPRCVRCCRGCFDVTVLQCQAPIDRRCPVTDQLMPELIPSHHCSPPPRATPLFSPLLFSSLVSTPLLSSAHNHRSPHLTAHRLSHSDVYYPPPRSPPCGSANSPTSPSLRTLRSAVPSSPPTSS